MAQAARTQETSKKVVRRKSNEARAEAGQVINWVLETHGALKEGVTLHESPAGMVRDYMRHRGIPLVEKDVQNITQALKRHPRYEALEAGSRARRPTFRLIPPKESIKLVPPVEDPPAPVTPPPTPEDPFDLEAAVNNLKASITASVEQRARDEHEAQLTLIRESLDNVTQALTATLKAVADVRDLL